MGVGAGGKKTRQDDKRRQSDPDVGEWTQQETKLPTKVLLRERTRLKDTKRFGSPAPDSFLGQGISWKICRCCVYFISCKRSKVNV